MSDSHDAVRATYELGISYHPSARASSYLRPYFVKPLDSRFLVFRRDQDHRVIQWISLVDDSSTTLDEADCEHLQRAVTIDADRNGLLYVLSEQGRRLSILDKRGALRDVFPWRMPGDPISVRCLENGSFLIGTWKPGGVYRLDHRGDVQWGWSPGNSILAEARSVAAGACGAYHIADATLHRAIVISASGEIVRQFGIAGSPGYGSDRLSNPSMLEVDQDGGVLVCDTRNHRVVKIDAGGSVAWEWPRRAGVTCRPTQLSMPWCVSRLHDGGLLIADTYNFRVLHLDENREILRSWGASPVTERRLSLPRSVQRLGRGRYLIADTYNNRIVEMDRHSRTWWQFGSGSSEELFWPRCALRIADGRTAIADSRHNRILFVRGHGIEKTISEFRCGSTYSTFKDPHDFLQTADGHLIVADTGNDRIVELDADGAWLSTFPNAAATAEGWRLSDPHNVSLDSDQRLIVSDTGNDRVLVVERPSGRVTELRELVRLDGTVTTLKEPRGCCFKYGHYFILDSGNSRILITNTRRRIVWCWSGALEASPLPRVLRPPRWLSVVSPRRILLSDCVNGRVVVLRLPRWWASTRAV